MDYIGTVHSRRSLTLPEAPVRQTTEEDTAPDSGVLVIMRTLIFNKTSGSFMRAFCFREHFWNTDSTRLVWAMEMIKTYGSSYGCTHCTALLQKTTTNLQGLPLLTLSGSVLGSENCDVAFLSWHNEVL